MDDLVSPLKLQPLISSTLSEAASEANTGDCEAGMRGRNLELLSGDENIPGASLASDAAFSQIEA